jgi:L-alanine-DL-glutamate epimerase-like enolase superfamily enzyme
MPATRPTTITALEAEPLDIALTEPFIIATGQVEAARNVLVRITLADGTVGIGEAAPFPPSGGETQETALAAVRGMATLVVGQDAAAWRPLAARLLASFEHQATARAGVEVAILDALTRSWGVPLYQFFGGSQAQVVTDISIPIASPLHVEVLARQHTASGARTLKLKVGTTVEEDAERVQALVAATPKARLILDGNQGYTPVAALQLLDRLARENIVPILFEQPVHRHDLEGLRFVTEHAGVPVAADEAVHTAADALRVARMGAANVVNIKLMKSGVVEALDIAAVCRAANIDLMIGAMIESRLGSAASAHFVAGLGGFTYVDLDTPMLLAEDPFTGGYTQDGVTYALDPTLAGHGVSLRSGPLKSAARQ